MGVAGAVGATVAVGGTVGVADGAAVGAVVVAVVVAVFEAGEVGARVGKDGAGALSLTSATTAVGAAAAGVREPGCRAAGRRLARESCFPAV